jgi:hypothetical protein
VNHQHKNGKQIDSGKKQRSSSFKTTKFSRKSFKNSGGFLGLLGFESTMLKSHGDTGEYLKSVSFWSVILKQ